MPGFVITNGQGTRRQGQTSRLLTGASGPGQGRVRVSHRQVSQDSQGQVRPTVQGRVRVRVRAPGSGQTVRRCQVQGRPARHLLPALPSGQARVRPGVSLSGSGLVHHHQAVLADQHSFGSGSGVRLLPIPLHLAACHVHHCPDRFSGLGRGQI